MELYKWLVLARIHDLCSTMTIIFAIIGFLIGFFSFIVIIQEGNAKDKVQFSKLLIITVTMFFCFCLMCCFCPSRNDLAIMFSYDAIKSDTVCEVIDLLKDKYL